MTPPIRVRALRLRGTVRDYEIRFDRDGAILPASVIAGPMRTGKTSALLLIDWCFGAGRHPEHPELERVTAALLEVDLRGRTHVIARHLWGDTGFVQVHASSLAGLAEPHGVVKRDIGPAGDDESLLAYLVDVCGLAGSTIRRRPTADDSEANPLSYRNLSWLAYLPADRLEGHRLLHEDRPQDQMQQHRQTLDIAFDVADAALSQATARLGAAKSKVAGLETEIRTIERFLGDEIRTRDELQRTTSAQEAEYERLAGRLREMDQSIRATDNFPRQLRAAAEAASREARKLGTRLRDRQTLLERLTPLRQQYSEELRKLNFVQEARQVLDPLPVVVCPVCASPLPAPGVAHGTCELCGQTPPAAPEDAAIDLSAEVRSVEARLRELGTYIGEIDAEIAELEAKLKTAREHEVEAQRTVDQAAREAVTPYLAERDTLSRQLADARASIAELKSLLTQRAGLDELVLRKEDARRDVELRQAEVDRLQKEQPSRDAVLAALGRRFESLMVEVGFPDLANASVDGNYAPIVNGRHYSAETSSGAQTLISVCWQLAVFEQLVEEGIGHPGYLLIDSIQKGLAQQPVEGADDRYSDPAIVERLYVHIRNFVDIQAGGAQVVIVDNTPPEDQRDIIVAEFTRDPANPPYGLIDDAIPAAGETEAADV